MPAPDFTPAGERLFESVDTVAPRDEEYDHALGHYCAALATMLDEVGGLVSDTEDEETGYSPLFDPEVVPTRYLDFAAQFVGQRLRGLSDDDKRTVYADLASFRRGTPAAMIAAARLYLTGSKTVYLTERHGSAYALTVATLISETPDPAATEAAVRSQKPAGIVLTYSLVVGGDYDTLRDTHTDYDDVLATFADYNEARDNPSLT